MTNTGVNARSFVHAKHTLAHIQLQAGWFAASTQGCTKLTANCYLVYWSDMIIVFDLTFFLCWLFTRGSAACCLVWRSFVLFSKLLSVVYWLSLFTLCTTPHNAGHFLRLILGPCLVIRDNCQLSQGTIRSITPKSMQPLGLNCFYSFSRSATQSCWIIKSKDGHKTSMILK